MSKFQPGDETFDDVTGHKVTRTNLPDEETEGHKLPVRGAMADDDADEVEGHRVRTGVTDEADEVEGHRIQRASEDEDVEGHRSFAGPADDETEGHRRPSVR